MEIWSCSLTWPTFSAFRAGRASFGDTVSGTGPLAAAALSLLSSTLALVVLLADLLAASAARKAAAAAAPFSRGTAALPASSSLALLSGRRCSKEAFTADRSM